ncbi:MAG: 1-(5-phosphoribosyl)-5-[(5-phosphoribosylamino)methylideneamino]imidazole-4-carboxamide isomerase [Flavobacteriales bacterium]|nr:1-(5-phosphoribosyl)-5-[(5-phosphoribosylamino)methylideneamino]imidazole-4-carboxamide isomerase [Flavobacteriales bacterium]
MKIIPAIDIIDGKCVRLSKGDYSTQKIYKGKPLEVAKEFEASGIKYLHLVDLDGAKSEQIVNYKTLEEITSQTNLIVDFGGGIKRAEDVRIAFESGAYKITAGSVASKNSELFTDWLEVYGSERIVLGADCKDRMIATNGWLESSTHDVLDFIQGYEKKGIQEVICTDISKDGMLQGPSFELYKEILRQTKVQLIASGGVTSFQDLLDLKALGCAGAIIGKAIYEGKITLKELERLC